MNAFTFLSTCSSNPSITLSIHLSIYQPFYLFISIFLSIRPLLFHFIAISFFFSSCLLCSLLLMHPLYSSYFPSLLYSLAFVSLSSSALITPSSPKPVNSLASFKTISPHFIQQWKISPDGIGLEKNRRREHFKHQRKCELTARHFYSMISAIRRTRLGGF